MTYRYRMFRQGEGCEAANFRWQGRPSAGPGRSVYRTLSAVALPEERRLLILFGVLWIVIGFVACVLGGER